MTNPYYNGSTLSRHVLARVADLNSAFAAVAAGFEKLPNNDSLAQGKVTYTTDTGSANVYAAAMATTLTSYAAGQRFSILIANTNTGASTLNIDNLGARSIKRRDGTDVEATDLTAGDVADFVYDGTNMILTSPSRTHMAGIASNLAGTLIFTGAPDFSSATNNDDLRKHFGIFESIADFQADTRTYTVFTAGDVIVAGDLRLEIAASGASDHHYTSAGGVKAYETGTNYTTRARFVQAVARGVSFHDGCVISAGDLFYKKSTGATYISDAAGFNPHGEVVRPEHCGAVGDGTTDDTTKIASALSYLSSVGGGVLELSPGKTYKKNDTAGQEWVVPSDTVIRGAPGASIYFDDTTATAFSSNRVFYINGTSNVVLNGLKITGRLATDNDVTNQKQTMAGTGNTNLKIVFCEFENLRSFATSFGETDGAIFAFNRLRGVGRDGARFVGSRNVHVVNNEFVDMADDAVALHSKDSPTDTSPHLIPVGHVVKGNIFENCPGVRALGAKGIIVEGNTFRRCTRHAVDIREGTFSTEGNAAIFSVKIRGNIILDSIALVSPADGINGCIKVAAAARSDLGTNDFANVNTSPFDYSYNLNTDDALVETIGAASIEISGNEIRRTLPAVTNYSDWGMGQYADDAYSGTTFYHDPAITDADFADVGIYVAGPVCGLVIRDNSISGLPEGCKPIYIVDSSGPTSQEIVGSIRNNTIFDCPGYAIHVDAAAADVHLDVTGNDFNLDPFFRDATHNSDNTWSSTGGVRGLQISISSGLVRFENNKCMHLAQPTNAATSTISERNNIMYADPAGSGNNASNKGVRVLNVNNIMVHYDADPTSATFGAVLTFPLSIATTQPSSGTYLQGHYVEKRNFSVVSGTPNYVVLGWSRLTTGSGHVAGTDWAEVRGMTS